MTVLIKIGTLSVLKMYIVSGFSLLLMKSIASCLVATVMIGRMGPKISSWNEEVEKLCHEEQHTVAHLHDWLVRTDSSEDGGGDVELLLVHLAANHGLALRGSKKT